MKKYKSVFLFLAACAVTAGMIALVNGNLSKILPDYKNEPRQYPHTITAEVSTVPSEQNEVDFTRPYKVSQACSFYFDAEISDKVYEAAEDTVRRGGEKIPTEAVKIMKANQFQTTIFSSKRKRINGRRYFDVTYEAQKGSSTFNCYLIYSEDKTEIYFMNAVGGSLDYPDEPAGEEDVKDVISSCKNLIADSGSELLTAFEPDLAWKSIVSTYDSGIDQPQSASYYLLRDSKNKIIVEYNPVKNEILSFSVGK